MEHSAGHPLLDDSDHVYDSTVFGAACPQFLSKGNNYRRTPLAGIDNAGQNSSAGLTADGSSEDCLSLAIWTPANVSQASALPVVVYLTGGGDITGGISNGRQRGANFVHRSQKFILVTVNYRLNIFGFPRARGIEGSPNFGYLDDRAAIEWVKENIAAFGGDPSKITLWGHSAGGSEST